MDVTMKSSIIRNIRLFMSLPDEEIAYLTDKLQETQATAGTILFHEGDAGSYLLVILSGQLESIKGLGTPTERIVAVRQAGEYVGEMSLLRPGYARSATVRARSDATLLKLTQADFNQLLTRQPVLAYEMTRTLSDRLDQSHNRAIQDLQQINYELQAAYDELKAAQAQIIEKEKLEAELDVARRIQESILPQSMPAAAGYEFDALMISTHAVGGDLFDFVAIDATHIGIAVADVAGKGVPAAIFMALTRSLLRAEALRSISPNIVLDNVNRVLYDMNTAGMFVTMVYGVLDLETRCFDYARAGHPAPMLVRADQTLVEPPTPSAYPLGLFPKVVLDVQQLQLEQGDWLLIYTDGVNEAVNQDGEEFGTGRLRACLLELSQHAGESICRRLVQKLNEFRSQANQNDDITLASVYTRREKEQMLRG